jgi:hypothetical protein
VTATPSTPNSNRPNLFRRLARTSWIAPLCAIALGLIVLAIQRGQPGPAGRVQGIIGPALISLGLGAGVVALAGMARVGTRGVLWPALIGTGLNVALIASVALPHFLRDKPTPLKPLVHDSAQRVLQDTQLNLTLDIPAGFAEFPAAKEMQRAEHVFVKGDTTDRELDLILSVSAMPAALAKGRRPPAVAGTRTNVNLRTFNWRGIEVDGLVVSEVLLGVPFTTLNIQLPILPRAVQISVAGPTARQAELEQITAALLPSIDGPSNW